jgi:hypothetical protein
VDELEDFRDTLRLGGDLAIVNIDGEVREQKTLSGKGNAVKKKKTGRYDRKHYEYWWRTNSYFFIVISWPGTTVPRIIHLITGILPTFLIAQF